MTTFAEFMAAWLVVGTVVAVVFGRVVRARDAQVPEAEDLWWELDERWGTSR